MDWDALTDDEKILNKKPFFEAVAKKFNLRNSLLTYDDLVNEAILWYIRKDMPEHVYAKGIWYEMLKVINAEQKIRQIRKHPTSILFSEVHDDLLKHPKLTPESRWYLDLYYRHCLASKQIADMQGCTSRNITKILKKTKSRLKELLETRKEDYF